VRVRAHSAVGKTLYALLFVAALPVGLVFWARATEAVVLLPVVRAPWVGAPIAVAGLALVVLGMLSLIVWGKGLPMNAYPPPVYVSRGVFRFLRNPIYVGFVVVCVGASMFLGSASGLWLVSPLVALALAALVFGYERDDLKRRFGEAVSPGPLLSLPSRSDETPSRWDRVSTVVFAFVPWSIVAGALYLIGVAPDAVDVYFPLEYGLPVLEWTALIY